MSIGCQHFVMGHVVETRGALRRGTVPPERRDLSESLMNAYSDSQEAGKWSGDRLFSRWSRLVLRRNFWRLH